MIRMVLAVLFVAALAVSAWWLPQWLGTPEPATDSTGQSVCKPLLETCQWQTSGGAAELALTPLSGDELQLDLTLPDAASKPLIVLTGESMYMGEYPLALTATDQPGQYRVRFVPPFCTTGDEMVWRINLQVAGEPLDLPFRVLFSPSEAS
jgi:hypothetical protein